MPTSTTNIFDYCDKVREQFKRFSLGREEWAADIKERIEKLRDEDKWSPSALLQISPGYETKGEIADLVEQGNLHENWLNLEELRHALYRHQCEAIDTARRKENYIITAGTGSGKSLGYIIPIIDRIFEARQHQPASKGIKAIICYPMNALVNSQIKELEKYKFAEQGIRYARYTGDDDDANRQAVQGAPPDILLTNFMMLEYMLTRNSEKERPILQALSECEFLVMDELHTYRGRQGADIAMLIRRLRLFLNRDFLCIGTSATMTSGEDEHAPDEEDDSESKTLVADFATCLFGSDVKPQNIIVEHLARKTNPNKSQDSVKLSLHNEILAGVNPLLVSQEKFQNSAVAVWCEFTFGIKFSEQRLVRQHPKSIDEAAKALAQDSGIEAGQCAQFLRDFLTKAANEKLFAVRLHQFFSGPGQFLSTIKDKQGKREFSVRGEKDNAAGNLYYATHFCRHCSHEFHPVSLIDNTFIYRNIDDIGNEKDSEELNFGFITPIINGMEWSSKDEESDSKLPDAWLEEVKNGIRVKSTKKNFKPQEVTLTPQGKLLNTESDGVVYIFLPGKFRFCPNCGDVHDGSGRDVNRLASLNAEGRSSATTVLLISLLTHEPQFRSDSNAKTLAFSDNRQDAALQAGYFNDFIFTLKLRAGLLKALADAGGTLRHDHIADDVRAALGFTEQEVIDNPNRRREFLINPDNTNIENLQRMREVLRDIIGYYLMFDLRRGWRHNNPNLEKLHELEMQFSGVNTLSDITKWVNPPPFISNMNDDKRQELARTVLAHLLEEKCVNSRYMSEDAKETIANRARDNLTMQWYNENDYKTFEVAKMLVIGKPQGKSKKSEGYVRSGPNSRLGKKIRPQRKWQDDQFGMLPSATYSEVLTCIMQTLKAVNLVVEKPLRNDNSAWQINSDCLIWRLINDGDEDNYYVSLYRNIKDMLSEPAERADLAILEAREHTAQVNPEDRQKYEERFRAERGQIPLPVLVCSPTMELGVDISDLNTVYLRNVPPTPANYVQRSGRAGRAGTPALVVSYCAAQSPHDQYYFERQRDMVAGKIHAPTIELANQDLLVSHFNAIWLQKTGVAFPPAVAEIMDYKDEKTLPINNEYKSQLQNDAIIQEVHQDIAQLITDLAEKNLIPEYAQHWLTPQYKPRDIYEALETALNRWRSLYRTVRAQIKIMGKIMQDLTRTQKERDRAQALQRAAYAQEKILRTEGKQDFYSYRFLASQGFLPGYNFPRLPLVAFLPRGRGGRGADYDRLIRPRFLALSEFGPRSLIYHQGNRYRVSRAILRATPEEGAASTLPKHEMHICSNCGYGYLIDKHLDIPDCCICCTKPLIDAMTLPTLYEIQDFIAHQTDRINASEEERQRQGYELRTAYCFSQSSADRICGSVDVNENNLLLDYGQAATVWRINLGWRRRRDGDGFHIDPVTGDWKKSDQEGEDENGNYSERVIPYVKDSRNILIMRWEKPLSPNTTTTLRHALKLGMTEIFQIEENELSVEPLPDGENCNAFLYYESVEGGAGVLTRLPAEKTLLAQIAKAALRMMHYKLPEPLTDTTPSDLVSKHQIEDSCQSGCYRCLFSYYNQPDQQNIDRKDAPALSILLALAQSEVALLPALPQPPPVPETPANAPPSTDWQTAAAAAGWQAPDAVNRLLTGGITANYYYTEVQAAIFTDENITSETKAMLENAGILCINFPADSDKWQEIFQHPANKRIFT